MQIKNFLSMALVAATLVSCKGYEQKDPKQFRYTIDRFADLKVMRYQVPDWDSLNPKQKELLYYLAQAANCGRDILYDQNFKHNLLIRHSLEAIYQSYSGDKSSQDFKAFEVYLKRIWFSNGIHHHYGEYKIMPEFSQEYFAELMENSKLEEVLKGSEFCKNQGIESGKDLCAFLSPILFDPNLYEHKINLDREKGLIEASACNYYSGELSTEEAEAFYNAMTVKDDPCPISYGLNSRLTKKENGEIVEEVYKIGGLYSAAIEKIVFWLKKALLVAETKEQAAHIQKLIEYYNNGSLKTWDEYNVLWVNDHSSLTDYVNGFIEVYGDPLGMKASWEASAHFKNIEATKRTDIISSNAQWFEDNSPVDPRFKKPVVKGVSAKVITVAQLGGDCFPTPPIGINLPNADWIRRDHGSKSVTIENLTDAYNKSAEEGKSMLSEFAFSVQEIERAKAYAALSNNLHTDLHECLGHGSGQLLPGVSSEALKNYSSTLEETRADLFALYYLGDEKLIELGLIPSLDVAWAEYDSYIRNGLMTQLVRIEEGKNIQEAHMRNRALIANWVYEKGLENNVIEKKTKNAKTYFVINNYQELRNLFAQLLAEVQRIKSEGDYEAGKILVEKYGVEVDRELHKEVLQRYATLELAPYGGFVNPKLSPKYSEGEKIEDVEISYPDDFAKQMLEYSQNYSFLAY